MSEKNQGGGHFLTRTVNVWLGPPLRSVSLLSFLLVYLAYAELVKPFDCIFISSVKRLDPTGKLR